MSETTIIYVLTGLLIGTAIGFVLRIRKIQYDLDFMRGQVYGLRSTIEKKDMLIGKYSETIHELTQTLDEINRSHEDFLKEKGIKA